jgi:hypothetical protein
MWVRGLVRQGGVAGEQDGTAAEAGRGLQPGGGGGAGGLQGFTHRQEQQGVGVGQGLPLPRGGAAGQRLVDAVGGAVGADGRDQAGQHGGRRGAFRHGEPFDQGQPGAADQFGGEIGGGVEQRRGGVARQAGLHRDAAEGDGQPVLRDQHAGGGDQILRLAGAVAAARGFALVVTGGLGCESGAHVHFMFQPRPVWQVL